MNDLSSYPLTRRRVLDRLRGVRRSARKLHTKLNRAGPIENQQRHELYEHAGDLVRYTDEAIRLLDEVRPKKKAR